MFRMLPGGGAHTIFQAELLGGPLWRLHLGARLGPLATGAPRTGQRLAPEAAALGAKRFDESSLATSSVLATLHLVATASNLVASFPLYIIYIYSTCNAYTL